MSRQLLEPLSKVYLRQLGVVDVSGSRACLASTAADNGGTILSSLRARLSADRVQQRSFFFSSSLL